MTHNLCVIALVWRFCMALKVEWYQAKRKEISTCFLNLNQQAHQKTAVASLLRTLSLGLILVSQESSNEITRNF